MKSLTQHHDYQIAALRSDLEAALRPELRRYLDEVLDDPEVDRRIREAVGAAIFGTVHFECERRSSQSGLRLVKGEAS